MGGLSVLNTINQISALSRDWLHIERLIIIIQEHQTLCLSLAASSCLMILTKHRDSSIKDNNDYVY
mgnify:FL=1